MGQYDYKAERQRLPTSRGVGKRRKAIHAHRRNLVCGMITDHKILKMANQF